MPMLHTLSTASTPWAGLDTLISRDWKNNPPSKEKPQNQMSKGNFAYDNNLALDQEETEENTAKERSKSVVSQQR